MKFILTVLLALALASPALAGPQSTVGGARLEHDNSHRVASGWPGTAYEWWNKGSGRLDWAIGGELVYGPWSGAFDDPRIAFAAYAPIRIHLYDKQRPNAKTDLGLRITPGFLAGSARRSTPTVGGRIEVGVPVSVDVNPKVSLVTGGTMPVDLGWVKFDGFGAAISLLFRMGVEIKASKKTAPFILFEAGPGFGARSFRTGKVARLAARVTAGTTFWGVLGGK